MTSAPAVAAPPGQNQGGGDGRSARDSIERMFQAQQNHRAEVAATTAPQRIEKIRRLERAMLSRRDEIRAAMWEDYRKPAAEVDLSEIYPVVSETRHARRHLRSWMQPRRVSTRLALFGSSSSVVYEPKGVALILAPWNFPFNLTLGPLVSAIAAGNCVVLKPSEMTPASSACMKRIVGDLFPEEEVAVVEGDAAVAQELLRKRFDHIFFTGSPAVGKVVMKAAAEHLASVTLELGGKSPVFVDASADLAGAARKIAWGKFFNSGQVCIAPDYVLVEESVRELFLERLQAAIRALGEGSRGIMVDDRHGARVRAMLDDALAGGARVVTGGTLEGRNIPPTVLTGGSMETSLMREEIFGPLLPVIGVRDTQEAIDFVNRGEKPLTMYVFSRDRAVVREIVRRTRAGSTAVNQTMVQFYELELPFGGVGNSGVGKAHGAWGFEAFSNARAVLRQWLPVAPIDLLYPPYRGRLKQFFIDFTVRWL